jgi:myo-inositol-1(or 4)-monophosphatase
MDPDELGALAAELATEAGALLREGHDRVRTSVQTKSTGTDMVTEMDRASERFIVEGLLARRPADGVLGEEGAAREGTSGVRWIIDPLDGTTNYLYGFPSFAVSIGAEVDGVAVAGAVHDVVHGETFTAVAGAGAWCDGRSLRINDPPSLAQSLVGTGFAYAATTRAEQAAVLQRVLPNVRDIRRAGAAAVDLCWVAAGRLDAYFERGLMPWDWAAGGLIAAEAGARTLVAGDLHVAAPPHLFDDLLALL